MKKKERYALITGAAHGLGAAIALALAQDGFTPLLHYRDSAKDARRVLKRVQQVRPKARIIRAELGNATDVRIMFRTIRSMTRRLDVLVNTVGDFTYAPLGRTTTPAFHSLVHSNLLSVWHCTKEALQMMRRQKHGVVVSFGVAGAERMVIREKTTIYYSLKSAVIALTKTWAAEEARNGIRLHTISPGPLTSSIAKPRMPSGRFVQFDHIISALRYLLQTDNPALTGANLEVTYGWQPGYY